MPRQPTAPHRSTVIAVRDADLVDTRLVDRAVRDLRALVVSSQIETVIRVGEYLLEHFYGGAEAARSHTPRKAASLAALKDRTDEFAMPASLLERAVPIALQARLLPRAVATAIPVSIHRALLPVRDVAEKRQLAASAAEGRWTYEQLRTRVAKVQRKHAGGRPREPAVRVLLRRLGAQIAGTSPEALREEVRGLEPAEARRLLGEVERLQAFLEKLEHDIERASARA